MKRVSGSRLAAFVAVAIVSSGATPGLASPAPGATFAPLHTYYISPTGSDRNTGLSPSSAWATPGHAVACGDVIIAAAGDYAKAQFGISNWGPVSKCPSTSRGIDGKGGVYFAVVLCAGPAITSCRVNGGASEAFRVDASNWAVEGFFATQLANAGASCFTGTSETNALLHHIAFINDIASHCALAGFATYSWHPYPYGGVDQTAVVGAITYDAAPSLGGGLSGSGISLIPENGPDTSAGTHIFVAGTFNYENINAPVGAGCNTDGEGLIFDSWGNYLYAHRAVVEQNVFWANGSSGFEAFPQGNQTSDDLAEIIVFNNTSYGNVQDPKHIYGGAELFLNQIYPRTGSTGRYEITDNIFEATVATAAGDPKDGTVYGAAIDCMAANTCPNSVIDISGNYIWNSHVPTTTSTGGRNTQAFYDGAYQGGKWPWGKNVYDSPGFSEPGGLPKTAPSCQNYVTTTDCMLSGYGIFQKLKPSGGAVGKGYVSPGPCKPDADFPAWLKGVVYLRARGSTITENSGLITKPCGL